MELNDETETNPSRAPRERAHPVGEHEAADDCIVAAVREPRVHGCLPDRGAEADDGKHREADEKRRAAQAFIKEPGRGSELRKEHGTDHEADAQAVGEVIHAKLRLPDAQKLRIHDDLNDPDESDDHPSDGEMGGEHAGGIMAS